MVTKNVTKKILQADSDDEGKSAPKRRKVDDNKTVRLKAYYDIPIHEPGDVSILIFFSFISDHLLDHKLIIPLIIVVVNSIEHCAATNRLSMSILNEEGEE